MKIRNKLMLINLLVGLLASVLMSVILINAFARTFRKNIGEFKRLENTLSDMAYEKALEESLENARITVSKQSNVASERVNSALIKDRDINEYYDKLNIDEDKKRSLIISDFISKKGFFENNADFYNRLTMRLEKAQLDSEGKTFLVISKEKAFPEENVQDFSKEEDWGEWLSEICDNKSGSIQAECKGREIYIVYNEINATGWRFCSVITRDEIGALADMLRAECENTEAVLEDEARGNFIELFTYVFIIIFVIILMVIALSIWSSGYFTRPIIELLDGVKSTGNGNLKNHIKVQSDDEIGELTRAYNEMLDNLSMYIEDVKKLAGEKERIEAEMAMAADIQNGMLPGAPIDGNSFHASGFMRPAKSVGGDFYDYFEIDENHVAFIIADVSDKGIPAALFMAIGRTVTRETAMNGKSIDEVFFSVNNILTRNNDNCQFITAFAAILDKRTGSIEYVNAGHEPPMILRKDGSVEVMNIKPGFVLGIMENMSFETGNITLDNGEKLYLYTDGVLDSVNEKEERFSQEGIVKFLSNNMGKDSTEEVIDSFVDELDKYSENMNQADDITMLLLKYRGQ